MQPRSVFILRYQQTKKAIGKVFPYRNHTGTVQIERGPLSQGHYAFKIGFNRRMRRRLASERRFDFPFAGWRQRMEQRYVRVQKVPFGRKMRGT